MLESEKFHILGITETWFNVNYKSVLEELLPRNFKILVKNREYKRGGGVCVIHDDCLDCIELKTPEFSSFEHLVMRCKVSDSSSFVLATVYRPPGPAGTFHADLVELMMSLCLQSNCVILQGDMNMWLEDDTSCDSQDLIGDLDGLHFTLASTIITNIKGHMLDALFTHGTEAFNVIAHEVGWSDHSLITFNLLDFAPIKIPKGNCMTKSAPFRKLKNITVEDFKTCYDYHQGQPLLINEEREIGIPALETEIERLERSLDEFELRIKASLDDLAPLTTVNRRPRLSKSSPWYAPSLNLLKNKRRILKRKWLKSKLPRDKIGSIVEATQRL